MKFYELKKKDKKHPKNDMKTQKISSQLNCICPLKMAVGNRVHVFRSLKFRL